MPRTTTHDVEASLQATIGIDGRGFDSIRTVKQDGDEYRLFIDTNHGERCVIKLDTGEGTLKCYGNTRVPPFLQLDLSANAAQKLRQEIEAAYTVET